jgi:hypothetical protein
MHRVSHNIASGVLVIGAAPAGRQRTGPWCRIRHRSIPSTGRTRCWFIPGSECQPRQYQLRITIFCLRGPLVRGGPRFWSPSGMGDTSVPRKMLQMSPC